MNETWDIVYTEGAQRAFTWFQGVRDHYLVIVFKNVSSQ